MSSSSWGKLSQYRIANYCKDPLTSENIAVDIELRQRLKQWMGNTKQFRGKTQTCGSNTRCSQMQRTIMPGLEGETVQP